VVNASDGTPITLRPIREADRDFLLGLYHSVREPELARVDWTAEQKRAFVLQQFTAQQEWWVTRYTDTSFDLVLRGGLPIGRLYVARWPREIRIVDIALIPEWRGRGLGSTLLKELMREGDAAGKPVSIHVEQYNPARRLYERLGFGYGGEASGVYLLMIRQPTS
jgi:ribosomal protein S18 acetylase RimI-like enzyme